MVKFWKTLFNIKTLLLVGLVYFVMTGYLNLLQDLTDIQLKLVSATQELDNTKQQLKASQYENTQMKAQYSSLRSKILTRTGYTQKDRQSFITPDDPSVSAKVLEITSGYNGDNYDLWSDKMTMYNWVVKNIDYSSDTYIPMLSTNISDNFTWIHDYWRTPAETLKDKTGDCEDMALLLATMFRNYSNKTFTK